MPAPGYVTISFPEELQDRIKELLKNKIIKSRYPYRNPTEFVRAAASEKIRELENEIERVQKLGSK